MVFQEIKGNLFEYNQDRTPAHCISQDGAMGAGIAVPMKKEYRLTSIKIEKFPDCVYYHGVLNLITKKNYWGKPTYLTLEQALMKMKEICKENNIKRIVMPRIGCGLDKLQWPRVREILKDIFQDTEVDILVCSL